MDEETLWVLKMLSARQISARSADRILRALELLRKSEESEAAGAEPSIADISATPPVAVEQKAVVEQPVAKAPAQAPVIPTAGEAESVAAQEPKKISEAVSEASAVESVERVIAEIEEKQEAAETFEMKKKQMLQEYPSEIIPDVKEEGKPEVGEEEKEREAQAPEVAKEVEEVPKEVPPLAKEIGRIETKIEPAVPEEAHAPDGMTSLLGDDGIGIIEGIPDGAEMMLEKSSGDVTIQSWDQSYIRAEGKGNLSTVLQTEKSLKIRSEDNIALYIPSAIGKISITSVSGSIDIEKYSNDIAIDNNIGDISIREASGNIRANSVSGSIMLEDYRGRVSLESKSGDITVKRTASIQIGSVYGTSNLEKSFQALEKLEASDPRSGILKNKADTEAVAGDADIGGDISVKSSGGNITMEWCTSQSIYVDSTGGSMRLRDVADNMNLKCENSDVTVENFSGKIRVGGKDTDISLRNSGDAEIYIESDGGDISIKDCYADVYVDSGTGNVQISGGSLAFGGMGKVDLKMKTGDAYLHRRTFEEILIAVENGNVDLNMEKLSSGGSGRISVDSGNITVRVLPSFRCEMIAHAPVEKIRMELPIKVIEESRNQLRGTLNGGGSKIELIAPDGEIRLQVI